MKNFSPTGKVADSALKNAVRPASPPCHQRRVAMLRPNFQSRLWMANSAGVGVMGAPATQINIDVNITRYSTLQEGGLEGNGNSAATIGGDVALNISTSMSISGRNGHGAGDERWPRVNGPGM